MAHASREIKRNREEKMARSQKRRDKTNMYSADNKNIRNLFNPFKNNIVNF